MELRSLQIFIEAAELGSFTRAGEKLGYSQPTVSFQIKQLEAELGFRLFDRIGHTVTLTDAGREALSYAQRIFHMSREMAGSATRQREARGVVRLGMADSLCSPLIVKSFSELRLAHPHVSLHITTAGTGELFRLLDHNEIDIVCTLDRHIYDSSYITVNEERVALHFIASSRSELARSSSTAISSLLAHPFLLTEKGMSYRRILDEELARRSLELHPILEMGSADLICELVAENMGISFLPDYVSEAAVRSGRIVRLDADGWQPEVWRQVIYRKDKWVSAPMAAILEHLSSL